MWIRLTQSASLTHAYTRSNLCFNLKGLILMAEGLFVTYHPPNVAGDQAGHLVGKWESYESGIGRWETPTESPVKNPKNKPPRTYSCQWMRISTISDLHSSCLKRTTTVILTQVLQCKKPLSELTNQKVPSPNSSQSFSNCFLIL